MTQQAKMRAVFLSVIALLCLCAITTYLTFLDFRAGEHWVSHTQEVRGAVGDVEAAVNTAARSRSLYLMSGSPSELENYHVSSSKALEQFGKLKVLTQDNPVQ